MWKTETTGAQMCMNDPTCCSEESDDGGDDEEGAETRDDGHFVVVLIDCRRATRREIVGVWSAWLVISGASSIISSARI